MNTGTAKAYSRSVAWGKECKPADADPDTVYVFDAREDTPDLDGLRGWLEGFPPNSAPLVAVVAPKARELMNLEELTRFDSAVEPLWAYPLDRPGDAEQDLLAHVSGLLPDQPLPGLGISPPEAPDYSMFADYPAHAFEKAAKRLMRRVEITDRFD